jgi:hypothetical protein
MMGLGFWFDDESLINKAASVPSAAGSAWLCHVIKVASVIPRLISGAEVGGLWLLENASALTNN